MSSVGNRDTTPFVWFAGGCPVFPPNTLAGDARQLLERLSSGTEAAPWAELIRYASVCGVHAVEPSTTWFGYLRDVLREQRDGLPSVEVRLKILRQTVADNPIRCWPALKRFIIDNIDEVSGWSRCWQRDDPLHPNIRRGEDGHCYLQESDGTVSRIIGAKPSAETRLDFIADSVLRPYGQIRKMLDVFSLFAVSADFLDNQTKYPKSMRLYAWDPQWGVLSPRWHMSQFFQLRTIKWRPENNLCDPEWLSFQLLGEITDTIDRDVWAEHIEAFKDKPNRIEEPWQMDYVLETDLMIGDSAEVWLEFEGKRFRWINPTAESRAILSTGCGDINNKAPDVERVNRFISALVWNHGVPIVKGFGSGGPSRSIPTTWGPRRHAGLRIDPSFALPSGKGGSQHKWRALALYKEGKNSNSVFYEFLNYWKILELAIPNKTDRFVWIENNVEHVYDGAEWRKQVHSAGGKASDYLYESCRNAISHVRRKPTVDPDDYEDNLRLSKDVRIMEGLAKRLIGSGVFD